jgi:hypothetical protein
MVQDIKNFLQSGDITRIMRKGEKMSERALVRFKPSLGTLIDRWRHAQLDAPSRPDAIRRLTAIALKTAGFDLSDDGGDAEPKAKKPAKKGGK